MKGAIARICAVVAVGLALSGCAAPIIGSLTLSQLSMIAGIASTATTGKGLTDHALSMLTGKDCNLTEAILHKARKLCEDKGSDATKDDFKGVFVAFGGTQSEPLDRMARARQQELATAARVASGAPVSVIPASLVGFSWPIRFGIPRQGEAVGLSEVDGKLVYLMPPVYAAGDPVAPPSMASGSSGVALADPEY
jgi:hypothetical protein